MVESLWNRRITCGTVWKSSPNPCGNLVPNSPNAAAAGSWAATPIAIKLPASDHEGRHLETLNLKLEIVMQPVGPRPLFRIEEAGHPLAIEQQSGITCTRAMELA